MSVEEDSTPFFSLLVVVYLLELHQLYIIIEDNYDIVPYSQSFSSFSNSSLRIFDLALYLAKHERHIIIYPGLAYVPTTFSRFNYSESLEDMISSQVSLTTLPPIVGVERQPNSALRTIYSSQLNTS